MPEVIQVAVGLAVRPRAEHTRKAIPPKISSVVPKPQPGQKNLATNTVMAKA